jgi:hypothetical protein
VDLFVSAGQYEVRIRTYERVTGETRAALDRFQQERVCRVFRQSKVDAERGQQITGHRLDDRHHVYLAGIS